MKTIDLHQDLLLSDGKQTSFESLKKNQVKIVIASAFPIPKNDDYFDPENNDLIEKDFKKYINFCNENSGWKIIKNNADIKECLNEGGPNGIIMHIEGLNAPPLPKITKRGVEAGWKRLQKWYDMGWRSCGLVWNLTNPLGGGTNDTSQGVTALGCEIIEWLQERNMAVDFSHMNEKTFWDSEKIMKGPIVVSHANTRELCLSPRNLSDAQLRRVAESDGLVGVFMSKKFITNEGYACITNVVNHINHLRNTIGIDYIALGTDFGGIISGFPEGLESIDKLPGLFDALRARGYTEKDIKKIAYQNAARVLHVILSDAQEYPLTRLARS